MQIPQRIAVDQRYAIAGAQQQHRALGETFDRTRTGDQAADFAGKQLLAGFGVGLLSILFSVFLLGVVIATFLGGLAFAPLPTLVALNILMGLFYLGNFVFKGTAEQGRSVGDTKEASIEALLNKSL